MLFLIFLIKSKSSRTTKALRNKGSEFIFLSSERVGVVVVVDVVVVVWCCLLLFVVCYLLFLTDNYICCQAFQRGCYLLMISR